MMCRIRVELMSFGVLKKTMDLRTFLWSVELLQSQTSTSCVLSEFSSKANLLIACETKVLVSLTFIIFSLAY